MDDLIECPCCKGSGWLVLYDEANPEDPPRKVICLHCDDGKVPPDNRSMNKYE